jgi:hypothetical protein
MPYILGAIESPSIPTVLSAKFFLLGTTIL